jgi:hypothetical protein
MLYPRDQSFARAFTPAHAVQKRRDGCVTVKQTSTLIRPRGSFGGCSEVLRSLPVFAALLIAPLALPRYGLSWEVVDFSKPVPPRTTVINTPERKLYFVLDDETAIRYPVAVPKRRGNVRCPRSSSDKANVRFGSGLTKLRLSISSPVYPRKATSQRTYFCAA